MGGIPPAAAGPPAPPAAAAATGPPAVAAGVGDLSLNVGDNDGPCLSLIINKSDGTKLEFTGSEECPVIFANTGRVTKCLSFTSTSITN